MGFDLSRLSETDRARELFLIPFTLDFGPEEGSLNMKFDYGMAIENPTEEDFPNLEEELEKIPEGKRKAYIIATIFCTIVREWDGVDEDGNPVPLEPGPVSEMLGSLGIATILGMVEMEAAKAPKAKKTTKSKSSSSSKKQGKKRRKS